MAVYSTAVSPLYFTDEQTETIKPALTCRGSPYSTIIYVSQTDPYNKALINRGSITFWLDDKAIQAWYESATPSSRGRPQRYSDLAITTVLVIKRVFRLTLRAAQGFIDS
ncbi:TPA: transposase, partial [Escherichia coli]